MSCCTDQKMIHTDTDIVCANCGIISINVVEDDPLLQKSRVIPCDEARVGSSDISPSSILHSKKQRNILESRINPYEKKLFDTCDALHISSNGIRRALYLFATIRNTKKIPLGNNAFFCIWQTCKENSIDLEDEEISATVRECFSLKRSIRTKKAIFMARSVILDCEKKVHLDKPKVEGNPLKDLNRESLRRIAVRGADTQSELNNKVGLIMHMDVDK